MFILQVIIMQINHNTENCAGKRIE